MGKQPVLLQLCQNYCASATDLQSADKTGAVTFIGNANKDSILLSITICEAAST
jgi:hypothetical protein